jgi:hypothetical protein
VQELPRLSRVHSVAFDARSRSALARPWLFGDIGSRAASLQ